jgi:hypothetical protein
MIVFAFLPVFGAPPGEPHFYTCRGLTQTRLRAAFRWGGEGRVSRGVEESPAQDFFTNSDFKFIAPMPSILQAMS